MDGREISIGSYLAPTAAKVNWRCRRPDAFGPLPAIAPPVIPPSRHSRAGGNPSPPSGIATGQRRHGSQPRPPPVIPAPPFPSFPRRRESRNPRRRTGALQNMSGRTRPSRAGGKGVRRAGLGERATLVRSLELQLSYTMGHCDDIAFVTASNTACIKCNNQASLKGFNSLLIPLPADLGAGAPATFSVH